MQNNPFNDKKFKIFVKNSFLLTAKTINIITGVIKSNGITKNVKRLT